MFAVAAAAAAASVLLLRARARARARASAAWRTRGFHFDRHWASEKRRGEMIFGPGAGKRAGGTCAAARRRVQATRPRLAEAPRLGVSDAHDAMTPSTSRCAQEPSSRDETRSGNKSRGEPWRTACTASAAARGTIAAVVAAPRTRPDAPRAPSRYRPQPPMRWPRLEQPVLDKLEGRPGVGRLRFRRRRCTRLALPQHGWSRVALTDGCFPLGNQFC